MVITFRVCSLLMVNVKKTSKENLEAWTPELLVTNEKINQLKTVLAKYPDVLLAYKEREDPDIYPDVLILEAFRLEKPLTSVDVTGIKSKRIKEFTKDLNEFFFVSRKRKEVHVSRLKTLVYIAKKFGLSDKNADLAGISYGYTLKQIVEYSFKRSYDLIK